LDVCGGELGSDIGEVEFAVVDRDQAEHGRRVDEGKKVIDLEIQLFGKVGEAIRETVIVG
jgi:hypothetical protein